MTLRQDWKPMGTYKKCNLTLAVSPTCPQHKPSGYSLASLSITSHLLIGRGLLQWQRVKIGIYL